MYFYIKLAGFTRAYLTEPPKWHGDNYKYMINFGTEFLHIVMSNKSSLL